MRRKIWVFSDPHFGHDNIIRYCNRPFKNIKEMDNQLVTNYNRLVRPHDVVYFLGDIGFKLDVIKKMKGKKILIVGNHDKKSHTYYYSLGFQAILESALITYGKKRVFLSHYPYRPFLQKIRVISKKLVRMIKRGRSIKQLLQQTKVELAKYPKKYKRMIHGHTHSNVRYSKSGINACVDAWNYGPVCLDNIDWR